MFIETIMIPKSINNGNDRDYIYLDSLNGNDNGDFLSFEVKSNKFRKQIPKLIEINNSKSKPIDILFT